jgi:hypothetical protein
MTELLVRQNNQGINAADSAVRPWQTKYGEQYVMDWIQRRKLQGFGYGFNVGALSTPVVGGGDGTVVDLDQPEIGMIIPDGTTIVPILIAIQMTTPLLASDEDEAEALAFVDTTAATVAAALNGTWANTITPKNLRIALNNVHASECTVKSVCSADTTDPTESYDLFHEIIVGDVQGTPATALWTKNKVLYEPKSPDYIVGPASLFIYWGGTVAVNAFAQVEYLEFPTADLFG